MSAAARETPAPEDRDTPTLWELYDLVEHLRQEWQAWAPATPAPLPMDTISLLWCLEEEATASNRAGNNGAGDFCTFSRNIWRHMENGLSIKDAWPLWGAPPTVEATQQAACKGHLSQCSGSVTVCPPTFSAQGSTPKHPFFYATPIFNAVERTTTATRSS
ncbi:hypothetical protein AMATHDRAFT_9112 [Amanita thiersii Skay4041]|uniref:Uncharacterized protein n=1 Tax=Amanita thiersii Skay4041 TaxID=703135 RepID=A0A2A9NCK7_9AGAR|nr:hypothetical protein AMATHDRAFT_9112 [Amanita thiersii Skay4041]